MRMPNLVIEILGRAQEIEETEASVVVFNRADQNVLEVAPPISHKQTYIARNKNINTQYIFIIVPGDNAEYWLEEWRKDAPGSKMWEILDTVENITNGTTDN